MAIATGRFGDVTTPEQPIGERLTEGQGAGDRTCDHMTQSHLGCDGGHSAMNLGQVAGRDDLRTRIDKKVAQLPLDVEWVHVHDHSARFQRCEEQHGIMRRVG